MSTSPDGSVVVVFGRAPCSIFSVSSIISILDAASVRPLGSRVLLAGIPLILFGASSPYLGATSLTGSVPCLQFVGSPGINCLEIVGKLDSCLGPWTKGIMAATLARTPATISRPVAVASLGPSICISSVLKDGSSLRIRGSSGCHNAKRTSKRVPAQGGTSPTGLAGKRGGLDKVGCPYVLHVISASPQDLISLMATIKVK